MQQETMTTDEMQRQIESMMPSPHQIVENLDKELEEKKRVLKETEKIRKGIKSILEHYKESGEIVCPYPFVSIEEALAWLEKQDKQSSLQTNERAWIYLVSDVLTWKDGIGQYLDDPRVQEFAKKLCSKYAQKLYNFPLLSNSSNIGKNEQKCANKVEPKWSEEDDGMVACIKSHLRQSLNHEVYIEWLKSIKQRMEEQQ